MLRQTLLRACLAASLTLCGAAHAALVTNGSFEDPLASPWSTSGDASRTSADAYSGSYSVQLGGADASLTYAFATGVAVDALTELSLFVKNANGPFELIVFGYSDGSSSTGFIDDLGGSSDWEAFSLLDQLTAGMTLTSFELFGNSGAVTYVDDVSTTVTTASTVPEPATGALAGLAMIGLWATSRRRANHWRG